jgi:RNA-directed DNA polymerase
MMYGREKSDLAIVAVKPTNKAGQPAAELVEPRAGAEGNASQQSTGRAQYRLERIRQAARQRKKEKFTALFHHISIDHLEEAFFELKENAAPGVDGLTCRDYEQHLERNLEDLHARVHRGAYRALPSRRVFQAGWSAAPDRGRRCVYRKLKSDYNGDEVCQGWRVNK